MRTQQRSLAPSWVAGSVRARHLLGRRLGAVRARDLARAGSLERALDDLRGSAYGRLVMPGMDLASAQRAIAATAAWHLRVLAGWLLPGAIPALRALAAWFELANIEDRLRYLAGVDVQPPFELGSLATVWPSVASAQSAADVRAVLAGSPWGDPGSDDPAEIALALRLSWGRRVSETVEEAAAWSAGATALLVAREMFAAGRPPTVLIAHRPMGIGSTWSEAAGIAALRSRLPADAAWVLAGVDDPDDLWRAEAAWWRRVEDDGRRLARSTHLGRDAVIGCAVLLGVDAWRTSGALEAAARSGANTFIAALDDVG